MPGVQIELQIRVPGSDLGHPGYGVRMQRRAAQVGVQHHSGRVDYPPQPRRRLALGPGEHLLVRHQLARTVHGAGEDPLARGRDRLPYAGLHRGTPDADLEGAHGRPREHLVHAGQGAQAASGILHGKNLTRPAPLRQPAVR